MAKTCCVCKENKSLDLFYRNKSKPDGFTYECKECTLSLRKKQRLENPSLNKEYCKKYYQNNKDKYYQNKPLRAYYQARRRAAKLQATPSWLTEFDLEMMKWTYQAAKIAESHYGEPYQVDHIVPLQGENVCGLHVPWNIQVITAHDNMSKGNKMPKEGLIPSQM